MLFCSAARTHRAAAAPAFHAPPHCVFACRSPRTLCLSSLAVCLLQQLPYAYLTRMRRHVARTPAALAPHALPLRLFGLLALMQRDRVISMWQLLKTSVIGPGVWNILSIIRRRIYLGRRLAAALTYLDGAAYRQAFVLAAINEGGLEPSKFWYRSSLICHLISTSSQISTAYHLVVHFKRVACPAPARITPVHAFWRVALHCTLVGYCASPCASSLRNGLWNAASLLAYLLRTANVVPSHSASWTTRAGAIFYAARLLPAPLARNYCFAWRGATKRALSISAKWHRADY